MQYQRHNFTLNFLNSVETDKRAAWDILVNEVNEAIINFPKEVQSAIVKNGGRLPANPSRKDLLDSIYDNIYTNEAMRKSIMRIIGKRHADSHFSVNGGAYDKLIWEGKEQKDFNMDGAAPSNDEETMNFIFKGAARLVQGAKDRVQNANQRTDTKKRASDNLAAKERQKNLAVSRSKGTMPTWQKVTLWTGAAVAVGLIAYMIYKASKTTSSAPTAGQ